MEGIDTVASIWLAYDAPWMGVGRHYCYSAVHLRCATHDLLVDFHFWDSSSVSWTLWLTLHPKSDQSITDLFPGRGEYSSNRCWTNGARHLWPWRFLESCQGATCFMESTLPLTPLVPSKQIDPNGSKQFFLVFLQLSTCLVPHKAHNTVPIFYTSLWYVCSLCEFQLDM